MSRGGRKSELERANKKGFDCGSGSYCSVQQDTRVPAGRTDPRGARPTRERTTPIFHRTKTTISDGKATTDLYILSDGNWKKAGTTTDGGRTYTFSDEKSPDGTPLVGAGVRQSLAAGGDMNKKVKAQITNTLKGGGGTDEQRLSDEQIRQTGAVDSNTATNSEIGDQAPGLDADGLSTLTIAANPQTSGDFGNWEYPLKRGDQDVIKFTMIEYTPPSGLNVKENQFTGRIEKNPQKGAVLGRVILPIQPTIVDNNSVNWQQDSLNPLELAALDLSLGTIEGGIEGAKNSIERIIGTVTGDKENVRKGILAGSASAAIGKNVLPRVTGAILNPNIELLFNGPSLRTFNYRFQLSAREKKETDQILGIISWFKRGMAVRRTPAELFLSSPNVFNIQYLLKGEDHPYINRIKTCALTNCSVDYTPTGSYMTFKDGSMVSYTINLTFEELEPIYQDEYKPVGKEIGF
jgi:hypothetical protein